MRAQFCAIMCVNTIHYFYFINSEQINSFFSIQGKFQNTKNYSISFFLHMFGSIAYSISKNCSIVCVLLTFRTLTRVPSAPPSPPPVPYTLFSIFIVCIWQVAWCMAKYKLFFIFFLTIASNQHCLLRGSWRKIFKLGVDLNNILKYQAVIFNAQLLLIYGTRKPMFIIIQLFRLAHAQLRRNSNL